MNRDSPHNPGSPASTTATRSTWGSVALAIGVLTAWVALLGAPLSLWDGDGARIISSPRGGILLGGALALTVVAYHGVRDGWAGLTSLRPSPLGAALVLGVLFVSDWLVRGYNLFQAPSIRGEILLGAAVMWLCLRRSATPLLTAAAIATPLFLAWCFTEVAAGRVIFADDHPVFQFRLESLKRHFPMIPFFHPLWNGGIDARDFFATGALNVYLPFSPFIELFDVTTIYNYIVITIVFFLGPLATFSAARLERYPSPVPAIAAVLHITVSLLWYRWALKYGTMGFVVSASLVPLNLALAHLIFARTRELTLPLTALAAASFSLMLCWSLAGIVFIPCIILAVFLAPRLLRKRNVPLLAGILLALNLPWIALFWSVSNVGTFVKAEKATVAAVSEQPTAPDTAPRAFRHKSAGIDFKTGLKSLRESAISTHPLILLMAIPGFFLLRRESRLTFALVSLWLLLLGTIGVALKPQLELDRMLLMLAIIACVPSALALQALFERASGPRRGIIPRGLAALSGGFLLAGPFIVSGIIHNRSLEQYFFADSNVAATADAIKRFGGPGRVLFSGFVLHEFSQGHLAPLVYMTERPLMASSFVHDKWRYEQIFPAHFISQKDTGIRRYLDLYNVTAVFAHEPLWRQYFRDRPAEYTEVWQGGRFVLFERRNVTASYILEGAGTIISQNSNGVRFSLTQPDAVLKFNYFPFLRVPGCTVSPAPIEGPVVFVRLTGCPVDTELELASVDPITRFIHHE